MPLFFRCRSCGGVHAVPELAFYEIVPDGIWIKCHHNGKYELHRLISEPRSPRAKRNGALFRSWLGLKERAGQINVSQVKERVKGLLGWNRSPIA